jgi:hypothetical protein
MLHRVCQKRGNLPLQHSHDHHGQIEFGACGVEGALGPAGAPCAGLLLFINMLRIISAAIPTAANAIPSSTFMFHSFNFGVDMLRVMLA